MEASAPRVPQVHLIETARGGNLFVADGSRLFAAGLSLYSRFESAIQDGNSDDDFFSPGQGWTRGKSTHK